MSDQPFKPDTDTEEISEELYERMSLTIDKGQEPIRIDKFLTARLEGVSRNKIQQGIKGGRVTINGSSVKPWRRDRASAYPIEHRS
jgi:23S rRNA pseudouridine1911/1915/1917 synthase